MSAEQDRNEQAAAEDLELTQDEAAGVKGGVMPIEGGDTGSSGFSASSIRWKIRRRTKKQKQSGSTAGGRPV